MIVLDKYYRKVDESKAFLKEHIGNFEPEFGLILGSGLGNFIEEMDVEYKFNYKDIPNFVDSTVEGHDGELVFGLIENKKVMAMRGRFHFYEGYAIEDVVFPVRVMIKLGMETLIVTNAAGGVNRDLSVGDLMIIEDHINFTGINPLIGENNSDYGPRFPDMSEVYNKELISLCEKNAKDLKIDIKKGTYMWMTGPSYETPAEIKMADKLGVSAVGMSTVPETIVANHGGINILGISCITNMASGILEEPLDHEDVILASKMVNKKFKVLIKSIISSL